MTVLHTIAHLERGGTQRYLLGLDRATREAHLQIRHVICTFGSRNQMLPEFEAHGLDVISLGQGVGARGRYDTLRELRRTVASVQPDLIQTHSRWDRPYAYLAARTAATPIVNSLHSDYAANYGSALTRTGSVRDLAEKVLERRVGGIAVVSPHLADIWRTSRGREVPWVWVPPFVAEEFLDDDDPCADPTSRPLRLVTVSRLVPGKGIDLLVEALPHVRGHLGDVRLTVAGDGPQRGHLESRAAELGLADSVRFLGERTDVRRIHKEHHVFVLPTESEGYGIAAVEAVLSGLMVTVTALPSTTVVLGGVPSVRFIERRTPEDVAEAICAAAERMSTVTGIGAAARRTMLDRHDEGAAMERLLSFYHGVLDHEAAA